jgi:sensor c-di-GMP phosphodiesterase-like protein
VIRAILALAGELGLHVVAEGQGTEQAEHLTRRRSGRSYGFGRLCPV